MIAVRVYVPAVCVRATASFAGWLWSGAHFYAALLPVQMRKHRYYTALSNPGNADVRLLPTPSQTDPSRKRKRVVPQPLTGLAGKDITEEDPTGSRKRRVITTRFVRAGRLHV